MPIERLFRDVFPDMKPSGNGQFKARCIFHNEKDPSLSIKLPEGIYYCHGCSAEGNAVTLAKFLNVDPTPYYTVKRNNQSINGSAITTKKEEAVLTVEERHYFFSQQANEYNQCIAGLIKAGKTGNYNLTPKTVSDFLLGYDPKHKVLVFPITQTNGKIFALKYHKRSFSGGKAVWYPQHLICNYKKDVLLIVEGEKDAVNAYNMEFQVATNTTGAGSVPIDMRPVEGFKEYIIWYDFDRAGNLGSRTMAAAVAESYLDSKVSIVDWRYEEETYQLKDGHDISDLIKDGRSDIIKSIYDNRQQYKPERKGYMVNNLSYLMLSNAKPNKPIVPNLLYENGVTIFAGTDGTRKTWFVLDMALNIASGHDFLCWKVQQKPVLLLQFELSSGQLKNRLSKMLKAYPDYKDFQHNFKYMALETEDRLFVDQWKKIRYTLDETRFSDGVIIVDNLYSSTDNISDLETLASVLSEVKYLCNKYRVSMLLVGHHNKGSDEQKDLHKDQIQGGKPLTNFATNVFQIHSSTLSQELFVLKITKPPRDESCALDNVPFKLYWRDESGSFNRGAIINKIALHFLEPSERWELKPVKEMVRYASFRDDPVFDRNNLLNHCKEEWKLLKDGGSRKLSRLLNTYCEWGIAKKLKNGQYRLNLEELYELLGADT